MICKCFMGYNNTRHMSLDENNGNVIYYDICM